MKLELQNAIIELLTPERLKLSASRKKKTGEYERVVIYIELDNGDLVCFADHLWRGYAALQARADSLRRKLTNT